MVLHRHGFNGIGFDALISDQEVKYEQQNMADTGHK